jgi:hypothetical protein
VKQQFIDKIWDGLSPDVMEVIENQDEIPWKEVHLVAQQIGDNLQRGQLPGL